ncbi:hypothetical protein [Paludisphaera mucosa]|uniref:Uncharacterized protein n=1 Tax=Paludisphaera mucosa TaxID=3030827 RepID=A0ABT6FJ17_9BACT|nr:hypothetical protein [Paludisphaera mucosa]MDG3007568.1 hypothetical protein [Paludisphaera mucosa]
MEDSRLNKIAHVSRNHLGHSRLLVTYRKIETRLLMHETAERSGASQNQLQNQGVDYWCEVVNTAMDRELSTVVLHETVLSLIAKAAEQLKQEAAKQAKPKAAKVVPDEKVPAPQPEHANPAPRRARKTKAK